MKTLLIIMTMLSMSAPLSKNLLSLGTILMMVTILSTTLVSNLFNSWYAFILFLVFITGMLVLFSYMVAMSPNTSFTQKKSMSKIIILFTLIFLMTPILMSLHPMKTTKNFEYEVQNLFNQKNMPMYWSMGIILLVALIMAVSISYKSAKPLRPYLS